MFVTMMKSYHFLLALILVLLPVVSGAQAISGRIVDEQNKPLEFVNVVLLNSDDSSFVQGTVSENDGTFIITMPRKDGILKVSSVGYKTTYAYARVGNMGDIQLQPDVYSLGEVTVKGNLPQVEMSDEGIVVNVQNSILRQAGTADDLLGQIPRVEGANGSFQVFGKGTPIIYINNRKLLNTSELRQLKSSDVKEVEVITNPGAQYGGTVQSVIRIHTIRRPGDGWSLSSYSFMNLSRKFSPYENLSVKYRHNRLELFGNFNISSLHNKQYSEFEQSQQGDHSVLLAGRDTIFNNGDKLFRGQLGANFDIDENNSIGFTYGLTKSIHDVVNSASNMEFTVDGTADEKTHSSTAFTANHTPDHEFNAYYTGKIGKLAFDFNGTYYRAKKTQSQSIEEYSSLSGLQQVDVDNVARNRMWAGKLIFTYPIYKGKLYFGSEYTNSRSEGNNVNAQQIFENSQTKIKESNIAGFFDYSITFGNFRARAGLRYEHVVSDYYSAGVKQDVQVANIPTGSPTCRYRGTRASGRL